MSSRSCIRLLLAGLLATTTQGQVNEYGFQEPDGQRRDQTFNVLEFENSRINQNFDGALRYYCTFRGKWNEIRQPLDFPRRPSWSAPVMISHSNGYRMWTGSEAATPGVESIAEEGFATIITNEFNNAGVETLQMVIGERLYNTSESQHLPPINVTITEPFISTMVKMIPSPDWFTGFSDWRTINPVTETYYSRIVIRTFPWRAGTDEGQTYTALDRDRDPPIPVSRIVVDNVPPRGSFLDPSQTYVPIVAEWECLLRVGEGDINAGQVWNEAAFRPPLYVPRDDDILPDGTTVGGGPFGGNNGKSGAVGAASLCGSWMALVAGMLLSASTLVLL